MGTPANSYIAEISTAPGCTTSVDETKQWQSFSDDKSFWKLNEGNCSIKVNR